MLNVAVIGSGSIGTLHAEAVASAPVARLVALGYLYQAKAEAEAEAEALGCRLGARAFADHAALLEQAKPDAVMVAPPR